MGDVDLANGGAEFPLTGKGELEDITERPNEHKKLLQGHLLAISRMKREIHGRLRRVHSRKTVCSMTETECAPLGDVRGALPPGARPCLFNHGA